MWLFGLAGGVRATGAVLYGTDSELFTLFSRRSKEEADVPNTKLEIMVQH